MNATFDTQAAPVTIDLAQLLRDYLLGLVLIAGGSEIAPTASAEHQRSEPHGRPVQWVHASDLADPTPFLTPRTVLLTTGRQFGSSLNYETASAYVLRLKEAGTTALGLGVGVQWDRIPPALIDACEQLQLPLFRVPYDTPFIAIVRTAARLLEAASHKTQSSSHGEPPSSLAHRHNIASAEAALRSAVATLLLAGQHTLAEDIANPILPRLPRGQVSVLSVGELSAQLQKLLTPLAWERPGVLAATHEGALLIISEHDSLASIQQLLIAHNQAAGISEQGSLAELPELRAQAARAAELAQTRGEQRPLRYRPEMHAGVMQLLHTSPEAIRRAKGLLSPITTHDQRHGDELLHSLTTWLAHHGHTSPAAAELGLHRHTLRTRVQTAQHLLQRDFADPDVRTELWAAIRLLGHAN